MQANLVAGGFIVFSAEDRETDAGNARAIVQAALELSPFASGQIPEELAWVDEFAIAAWLQPRHGHLSTVCLSVEQFKQKRLNLKLMYGRVGELFLSTEDLTISSAKLPFMIKRVRDLAICFHELACGKSMNELFQASVLRQRLACYSLQPEEGETDWSFRKRFFSTVLTSQDPGITSAVESFFGSFIPELDQLDLLRAAILGGQITETDSDEEVRTLVQEMQDEYQEDPLVTRQRERSPN